MTDTLINLAKSNDFLFLGAILIYFFIVKFNSIKKFIEQLGKPETSLLNEMAENKFIDSKLKNIAIKQLNKEYFYKLTKVYIEDPGKRDLLMKLSEESDNKLLLIYLKKAYKYLKFEGSNISISITKEDRKVNKKQKIGAIFLFFLSLLFILAFFDAQYNIKYLAGSICSLILSFSLFLELDSLWFAEKIEEYCNKSKTQ